MEANLDIILIVSVIFLGILVLVRFLLLRIFLSRNKDSPNQGSSNVRNVINEAKSIQSFNQNKNFIDDNYCQINKNGIASKSKEVSDINVKNYDKNNFDITRFTNEELIQNVTNYSLSTRERTEIIREIGRRKIKEALSKLIELLYEPDLEIVTATSESLVEIGDPLAIEPLLEVTKKNEIKFLSELGIKHLTSSGKKSNKDKTEEVSENKIEKNFVVSLQKCPFDFKESTVFDISVLPKDYLNNDGTPISRKEIVLRGLKEPDLKIKKIAAKLAIGMNDKDLIPVLIDTLKNTDEHESVRYLVAEALGEMQVSDATDVLIDALKDKNVAVRYSAAAALGKLGGQKAIIGLVESLKDQNEYVRSQVAFALGKLQDKNVIKHLIDALHDNSEIVKFSITEALTNFDETDVLAEIKLKLENADKSLKISLVKVLSKVKSTDSINILRQILWDPDPDLYHEASLALIDNEAYELIEELIDATKRLDNEVINWINRVEEINSIITNNLKNSSLSKEFSASSINKLEEALRNPSPNVRGCAVNALAEFKSKEAVKLLKDALNDQHEYVRSSALVALGKLGEESILNEIEKFIEDQSDEVRYALSKMLANFDSDIAKEYLNRIIQKEKSIDIRHVAQQSLAKIIERQKQRNN